MKTSSMNRQDFARLDGFVAVLASGARCGVYVRAPDPYFKLMAKYAAGFATFAEIAEALAASLRAVMISSFHWTSLNRLRIRNEIRAISGFDTIAREVMRNPEGCGFSEQVMAQSPASNKNS
jgi:hypothetical protein